MRSHIGKIMDALELAKTAEVGCELTNFDVIELLGHIKSLEEAIALEQAEQEPDVNFYRPYNWEHKG